MKIGDLVQWQTAHGVMWYGVIIKRSSTYRFHVEWASGKQGWFHRDSLEVVCK